MNTLPKNQKPEVCTVILGIRLLRKRNHCTSKADLTGKTALVTGANSGIGFETAKELARRNARVIILCRNEEKGIHATNKIIEETKNKNIVLKITDLSLMKSVRKTAEEILREEERLDILINNAGLLAQKKIITDEGLEYTYATNHFGPFLLTNLLLGLLRRSAPSRVIVVSSFLHRYGKIELDNLCAEKSFPILPELWYNNTKLANVMFVTHLAHVVRDSEIYTCALEPGIIMTNFQSRLGLLTRLFIVPFLSLIAKSEEEGAQTTIHAAVSPDAQVHGKYFIDCKEADRTQVHPDFKNEELCAKLWRASEKLTGLVE
ncbi:hypothetical protein ScPMuIL_001690 [Solemya velum]